MMDTSIICEGAEVRLVSTPLGAPQAQGIVTGTKQRFKRSAMIESP